MASNGHSGQKPILRSTRWVVEYQEDFNNTMDEMDTEAKMVPVGVYPIGRGVAADGITFFEMTTGDIPFKFCINCAGPYTDGEKCCEKMCLWVPEPKPEEINCCISHAGCPDGDATLHALHRMRCMKYGHSIADEGITYLSYFNKKKRTAFNKANLVQRLAGLNVMICDYAYPRDMILDIKKVCNKFILLDHHISNLRDVEGEPNCYFAVDIHSGAYMAKCYLHYGEPMVYPEEWEEKSIVGELVLRVEDRDMWWWNNEKCPDNRAFSTAMYFEKGKDFFPIYDLVCEDPNYVNQLIAKGKILIEKEDKEISTVVQYAAARMFLGKYPCRVANYSGGPSEVANQILLKYPDAQIALVWRWNGFEKIYKCSIRKRKDDGSTLDLGYLAQRYFSSDNMKTGDGAEDEEGGSGGGHVDAAGFSFSSNLGFESIFSNNFA